MVIDRVYDNAQLIGLNNLLLGYKRKRASALDSFYGLIASLIICCLVVLIFVWDKVVSPVRLILYMLIFCGFIIGAFYKAYFSKELDGYDNNILFIEQLKSAEGCKLRYKLVKGYGNQELTVWVNDKKVNWFNDIFTKSDYEFPVGDVSAQILCVPFGK